MKLYVKVSVSIRLKELKHRKEISITMASAPVMLNRTYPECWPNSDLVSRSSTEIILNTVID